MAIEYDMTGKDPEIYGVFQRPVGAEETFGSSTTEPMPEPVIAKRNEAPVPQPTHETLPA